ncbi:hypothetical protein KFE96_03655 [Kordiimonas sp. SCSIO 12603]|uniref:hypothetical protein n=1 Tax=Kordiimonas sp. SCSIO 12603 TaxID=2829596 RepID=UPI002107D907|nr:hypothetical protein [Kordiimonas sp. SCSIO 12603]UTW59415.1 hypothetical protein KFE96_03655 [Kordiimonas sp. SCSIO 12603]
MSDIKLSVALDEVSAADFAKYADKTLTVCSGNYKLKVALVECVERPKSTGYDAKRTAFRLIFRSEEAEPHPLLDNPSYNCMITELDIEDIGPVLINRIMRPIEFGPGIYLQVSFN